MVAGKHRMKQQVLFAVRLKFRCQPQVIVCSLPDISGDYTMVTVSCTDAQQL